MVAEQRVDAGRTSERRMPSSRSVLRLLDHPHHDPGGMAITCWHIITPANHATDETDRYRETGSRQQLVRATRLRSWARWLQALPTRSNNRPPDHEIDHALIETIFLYLKKSGELKE